MSLGFRGMRLALVGAWVAACLGRTPAAAQELPLQHFSLAESGQDGFAVRRPDTLGHLRFSTRLGLDYAFNPLVFESSDPAAGGDFSVVRHHLLYHFNMALGLGEHVMLFAGLPTHWVMRGNGTIAGLSASGYGLADAFTGVRVRILGDSDDRFSLGAQGRLVLPTARWADDAATLAGEETVAGGLALLGELRFSRLFFNASVGTELRRNTTLAVAEASPELNYSLGVGMPFQVGLYELQARAELFGETSFASFFGREESGVEILVGPQLRGRRGFQGGLAVGPGFGRGRGIPDVRALLTMGWTAPADVNERPFQGQCQCSQPVPVGADADGDGVPDHQDYCVHVPAGPLPDSAHPGCPMDADQDGVPDAEDACPQQNAGDFPNPNKPGCPLPDADHDFVPEPPDACPDEPGVPSTDPARSGCPSKVVRIRNRKIEAVNATVYFDFDDDKVRNESMPVLRAIADVIQAATFIDHVRIDGHTDAQGSQSYNLELSRRRAQSIAKTLHRMGVGEERLRVSEYGEAKPADSNVTEEGRAANRRVEFHIVTKQQRRAIQPKRPGQ